MAAAVTATAAVASSGWVAWGPCLAAREGMMDAVVADAAVEVAREEGAPVGELAAAMAGVAAAASAEDALAEATRVEVASAEVAGMGILAVEDSAAMPVASRNESPSPSGERRCRTRRCLRKPATGRHSPAVRTRGRGRCSLRTPSCRSIGRHAADRCQ